MEEGESGLGFDDCIWVKHTEDDDAENEALYIDELAYENIESMRRAPEEQSAVHFLYKAPSDVSLHYCN